MKTLNNNNDDNADNNRRRKVLLPHNIHLIIAATTTFTLAIIFVATSLTTTPSVSATTTGNNTTATTTIAPPSLPALELSSQPIGDEKATIITVQDIDSRIGFENATNLTDNPNDSDYGQVAASQNNVYVVWQDSMPSDNRNYDIFIKKSVNNGNTFGPPVNLSNNSGFSEHPQIAAYKENVYVAWVDNTLGNKEILFARSIDNGTSFSKAINLSNTSANSANVEIVAFENYVYAVWLDEDEGGNGIILFKASKNGGDTFSNAIPIALNANDSEITFPKVAAYDDNVYIAWNLAANNNQEAEMMTDLLYVKSSDQGNTFGPPIKLNNNNQEKVGEAQIVAYKNAVYVIWGSSPFGQVTSNLFFTKSTDSGNTFLNATEIKSKNFVNPSNVEIVVVANNDDEKNGQQRLSSLSSLPPYRQEQQPYLYVVGQVSSLSDKNDEIFLTFSSDNGDTFSEISTNLSNNLDTSECPSIAQSENDIYITWQDKTPGNNEILFTKAKI
jgi:hypothetical protein